MITGQATVNRIISMLPPECVKSMTLSSRGAGETFTSVPWSASRKMQMDKRHFDQDTYTMMISAAQSGHTAGVFELFVTTETTFPKSGDKLTDSDGGVWQVKKVDNKMFNLVFKCMCLKNK